MDETKPAPVVFERDSPEFARVMAFTDGVFAIAVTLLVLDVTIPADLAADDLPAALWDLRWQIFSFFLSFTVIGLYWMLHHKLTSRMRGIDRRFMRWNLVQLAFIAFLPFPTSLVGEHSEAAIAVAVYAVNVAIVSALDTWLFRTASHRGLLDESWPPGATAFALAARFVPVPVFLVSVPIAWVSTSWARWTWILVVPASLIVDRFRPAGLDPDS
ncbi:MAG: DUF1211 domain-containing protein [Acidimicrobiia bacterium]|nr:DUF1211 domain-containing protein [Acidimicrobiia bacterium]